MGSDHKLKTTGPQRNFASASRQRQDVKSSSLVTSKLIAGNKSSLGQTFGGVVEEAHLLLPSPLNSPPQTNPLLIRFQPGGECVYGLAGVPKKDT